MGDAGVHDDELDVFGRNTNIPVGQRLGVEEKSFARYREAARHLVHDPDACADKIVFDALAEARDLDVGNREELRIANRFEDANLERGALGKAAALGDIRTHRQVETT